jgi:DNA-binding transcriptional LysR family regulator
VSRHVRALETHLDLPDRAVDLVDEGFDLAVRIGTIGQQGLVSRRIGWTRVVCCASPAWLARTGAAPVEPADLAAFECLTYTHIPVPNTWHFESRDGATHTVRIPPRHRANNGRMLVELALLGLGIVIEPDFIVAPEVRAGRLVRLLPGFEPPRSPIAAVYPSRRHLSVKVRAFVDFLAERFSHEPEGSLLPADLGGVDSRS